METRPYVAWDMIGSFMVDVFKAYGVPEEDAKICADVLKESDRRGIESHGCNRFKPIYLDRIEKGTLLPKTEIEILKETPTTLVMDAHDGMGMVASYHMMEKLIEKANSTEWPAARSGTRPITGSPVTGPEWLPRKAWLESRVRTPVLRLHRPSV